uniref:Uncharacterized protein n=1 Tax=Anguilla anguilla TaxID=7936 RepID=A0A0E9RQE0_ANGAN
MSPGACYLLPVTTHRCFKGACYWNVGRKWVNVTVPRQEVRVAGVNLIGRSKSGEKKGGMHFF